MRKNKKYTIIMMMTAIIMGRKRGRKMWSGWKVGRPVEPVACTLVIYVSELDAEFISLSLSLSLILSFPRLHDLRFGFVEGGNH